MPKRFLSIWFPYLSIDNMLKKHPDFTDRPFVLCATEHGKMIIKAASPQARKEGIQAGDVLASAKTVLPRLESFQDEPATTQKLLNALAEWCLRFSPIVGLDAPDGLLIDISGCAHLWGGERPYIESLKHRLARGGYQVQAAIADTIGAAWALAHYGVSQPIAEHTQHAQALSQLPPIALRIPSSTVLRMQKLGFKNIGQFMNMPKSSLRRRFGDNLLQRLHQALGNYPEALISIQPVAPYEQRMPCLDPICTATGITIALRTLLQELCSRLQKEGKGLRSGIFKGHRIDGNIQQIHIGTNKASHNVAHLFKLFELKIPTIEPALGIELFVLEASIVEDTEASQETLWGNRGEQSKVAELLDNIAGKLGTSTIRRYLPAAQHWPERSIKATHSLQETPSMPWPNNLNRPIHLLTKPEPIEVTVPLPDYPPILFIHKKKVYKLTKADGPERIEQEWWLEDGEARDYYRVEDDQGARYWLFRLGQYGKGTPQWFLHGFFA